ncbi:uncharacterized protein LOC144859728 [Branchiostoma floridae x Branchiostoma japonicum]
MQRLNWYGAPEVFKRLSSLYTKESDIYSMGAMFAAMLDRTTVRGDDGKLLLAVYMVHPQSMTEPVCFLKPVGMVQTTSGTVQSTYTVQPMGKVPVGRVQHQIPNTNLSGCIMMQQPNNYLKQLILEMMSYSAPNRPRAQQVKCTLNSTHD